MRAVSEMRLARLCFAPSVDEQIDAEGWTTVFTLAGLTLPGQPRLSRDDYSYEQRLSVALLYLVSQFARKLLERHRPQAAEGDLPRRGLGDHVYSPRAPIWCPRCHGWAGRGHTALILVSQNACDLLRRACDATRCPGVRVPFDPNAGEVANVMCAASGSRRLTSTRPCSVRVGNGECIYRYLDDRAGRIGFDLVSSELQEWIDTNLNPGQAQPG